MHSASLVRPLAHIDREPCATGRRRAVRTAHVHIVHALAVRLQQRIVTGTSADGQHIRTARLQMLGDLAQIIDARPVDMRQQIRRSADVDEGGSSAADAGGGQMVGGLA